jgi:AcrR family transcriptional regulator
VPARARRAAADVRGKLTREQLVDAALDIADAEGLDALTIRKLAVALGVTPMALYWHVADKDALLDALGERIFSSVDLPEPAADWFDDLCAISNALVAALQRHPAVAPLAVTTVLTSEAGADVAERVLARLGDGGFDDRDAANIGAYLLRALVGLVTALPGADASSVAETEEMRRKGARLAALPSDRYPVVTRLAGELTHCEEPDDFLRDGVNLLMFGVRSLSQRASAS